MRGMRRRNCCKLQKTRTRMSVKGKRYYKFDVCILVHLLRLLGWKPGMLIREEIVGDSLVLSPVEFKEDSGRS